VEIPAVSSVRIMPVILFELRGVFDAVKDAVRDRDGQNRIVGEPGGRLKKGEIHCFDVVGLVHGPNNVTGNSPDHSLSRDGTS
jgi:hypothetical protein